MRSGADCEPRRGQRMSEVSGARTSSAKAARAKASGGKASTGKASSGKAATAKTSSPKATSGKPSGATSNEQRLPRLLALVPYLQAHQGILIADAAADFAVTEQQLRRDLQLLWMCGLPGHGPGDLIDL